MKKSTIQLPDAELEYYPEFYSAQKSDAFFKYLLGLSAWKQEEIMLFGRKIMQPRLTALFGNTNKTYTYSGLKMDPSPFPPELDQIRKDCEKITGLDFNTCLANLYRDGRDSMGWHSDDEKELGENPVIASLSFGAERIFHLKSKKDPTLKHKINLERGSLLVMKGKTQRFWKHQLPKTKKKVGPRVNLTFRKLY